MKGCQTSQMGIFSDNEDVTGTWKVGVSFVESFPLNFEDFDLDESYVYNESGALRMVSKIESVHRDNQFQGRLKI